MTHILTPATRFFQRLAPVLAVLALSAVGCGQRPENLDLAAAHPSGQDYSFAVWKAEIPAKLPAGAVTMARVSLINNGSKPWISTEDQPYSLSYHWKHPGGRFTSDMFWGERSPLPAYVGIGEMVTVEFAIRAPEMAKYYDITLDIVRGKGRDRNSVAWFEELGWHTFDLRLEVVAP